MCGRYSITKPAAEIADYFGVVSQAGFDAPRYNAAPTLDLPAIGMDNAKSLQLLKWGLTLDRKPSDGGSQLIINARIETVSEKKTFSNLVQRSRCLIPADGFFEWEKSGKNKQPWRFILEGESLFAFAGIYEKKALPNGQTIGFFCILTTEANTLIKPFHERMPVILDKIKAEKWLNSENPPNLKEFFTPYPSDKMRNFKVSPLLNNARINSPDLILPWIDPVLKLF
jgi:putative SOS response-associated peptidase YedK